MQIDLIGLNHGYQLVGCTSHDWPAFNQYLSEICQMKKNDLIAEELSEDAIKVHSNLGARGSVAKDVASQLGITHLFCDPNKRERKCLGIHWTRKEIAESMGFGNVLNPDQVAIVDKKERAEWVIREGFWLTKLQKMNSRHGVFILGTQHVASFEQLLRSDGFDARVEKEDWEP